MMHFCVIDAFVDVDHQYVILAVDGIQLFAGIGRPTATPSWWRLGWCRLKSPMRNIRWCSPSAVARALAYWRYDAPHLFGKIPEFKLRAARVEKA
jgi:hypothetical protein